MKKALFTIGWMMALILTFSACTKYSFQNMDEKIVGTWTYESVKNRPGIFRSNIDVTKNFASWELTIKENGEVESYNIKTQESKIGTWQMDVVQEDYYDSDGNYSTNTSYYLRFNLRDNRGQDEFYNWQINSVTAKKMKAYEAIDDESYNYVLIRK